MFEAESRMDANARAGPDLVAGREWSSAALDYRLAWSWLIPASPGGRVEAVGFTREEATFLRSRFGACSANGPMSACVVDADTMPAERVSVIPDFDSASSVCVIGSRRAAAEWRKVLLSRFAVVREYGLVPHQAPRVIVPIASRAEALAGLRLHRPGRVAARAALVVASTLVRLGIVAPLRRRVVMVAVRDPGAVPGGAVESGIDAWPPSGRREYALYLGAADGRRKTIALALTEGEPGVVAKIATNEEGKGLLRSEIRALGQLEGTAVAAMTPRLLDARASPRVVVLYQQAFRRAYAPARRLESEAVRFLAELSRLARRRTTVAESLRCLPPSGPPGTSTARAIAALGARGEEVIWSHRAHGDFAPWNCAWTRSGLCVYDWEWSTEAAPAFGDAFHFKLASARLLGTFASMRRLVDSAISFGSKVARAAGLDDADLELHLALWAVRRSLTDDGCRDAFYARLLDTIGERRWRNG